jgi:hypothetical protein
MINHDDELPPCVGEAMRDILAERAIALLDDWYVEAHESRCGRVGDFTVRRYPKPARGAHAAISTPFQQGSKS